MYTILIADDEKIECKGLELLVQESFKDIRLLPSVYNGTDLIRSVQENRPDIVLADINMPGLNGLEAIEIIRMRQQDIKIIICTAYNDFSYAQRAISLGAQDYLLKPVKRETLGKTLAKVFDMIDKERSTVIKEQKKEESFHKIREVAGREVISSIILGNPRQEEMNVWLETMDHTYWGGVFVAGDFGKARKNQAVLEEARELAKEVLQDYCTFLSKIYENQLIMFFFPGEVVGVDNYREWITMLLKKYNDEANEKLGFRMHFGVSQWRYDFEGMTSAFCEAVTALHASAQQKIHFFEGSRTVTSAKKSTELYIQKLVGMAMGSDWKECEEMLQWQIKTWEKMDCAEKERTVFASLLLLRCSKRITGYYLFSWHQLLQSLSGEKTAEELTGQMLGYLKTLQLIEKDTDTRTQYVCQAVTWIEEHYEEDLSLEELASQLGISPFYLSRMFSQKLKTGFVEMLTSVRINQAIEMVQSERTVIRNISNSIGYQAPTYFYKVFKKNTGVTIGEMRNLLLR